MPIIGIGIDIVKIARIKKIFNHFGNKLAKKILSLKEWNEYKINHNHVYFLSKRFAAKEAAFKALNVGINHKISLNQLEVYNDMSGKPKLRFLKNALKRYKKMQCQSIYVSISDEKSYACALVILEC